MSQPEARHGIRVLRPARYAGDTFECARLDTREDYERFRQGLGRPDDFEVVELDDAGQAKHRTVASEGGTRFACIDCGATSRNREPGGPCAGVTT